MRRRIARKILKRIGHKRTVIANCPADLWQPGIYKQGTVHRAIVVAIGPIVDMISDRLAEPQEWGLLDTSNDTWFGNDDGPFIFTNKDLARAQRQVLAARIPCPVSRISVEPFTSATRKLDNITMRYTDDEAMDIIEKRGY